MPTLAVVLMLIATVSIAAHGTIQRYVLREHILGKREVLLIQATLASIAIWGVIDLDGLQATSASNQHLFWISVTGVTFANLVIQYANVQSRHAADASLTAPVQGMTPLLVTLGAVTLGEFPGPQGITGVLCIVIGTWIHANERAVTWQDYLRPFAMLRFPSNMASLPPCEQEQVRKDVGALRWSYLSAVCGTVGLIFDGLTARSGSIALGYATYYLALAGCYGTWHIVAGPEMERPLLGRMRQHPFLVLGLGVFMATNSLACAVAYRLAPVAYVGSLKRLAIIMTVLFGWWFLGETKAKLRLWPALVITAGAMLLMLDKTSSGLVAAAYAAMK